VSLKHPSHNDRGHELQDPETGIRCSRKRPESNWFELGFDLPQGFPEVRRGQAPQPFERAADQRPTADRLGGRRYAQRSRAQGSGKLLCSFHQRSSQHDHRPDQKSQHQEREQHR